MNLAFKQVKQVAGLVFCHSIIVFCLSPCGGGDIPSMQYLPVE